MRNTDLTERKSEFLVEFNQLLSEIEQQLSDEECEIVNPSDLRKIANYIDHLKPLSKMRGHKKNLITYLESIKSLIESDQFNKTNVLLSRVGTLASVLAYLNAYHRFNSGNMEIHSSALIGFVIDVILSAIGVAKLYYYVPIIMLISLFYGIRKQRRLEAEGKILNL